MDQLLEHIIATNPLQRSFISDSVGSLGSAEKSSLEAYVSFCLDRGLDYEYLAACYNMIVRDTVREQLYFQRHGRYRYSKYSEVSGLVYQNDTYMKQYMLGLALTTYLWPNHRAIHRFLLSVLPRAKRGRYLEIGPGHGVYFMTAMRECVFERYHGIDVSPTSIELTRALLESGWFGRFNNYELSCGDFLGPSHSSMQYDAIVMGEVLEHVERPENFMARIRELSSPGAFVFVTTAINAPAIDHIYLFDSPGAVHALVEKAGFRLIKETVVPYLGTTLDESIARRLPINIALHLDPVH